MEMSFEQTSLIEENMGLISYVINKKVNKAKACSIPSVDYEDLYQLGAIGLCKAAKTFDEKKGFQFSTYAVCCIRNSINSELERLTGRGYYNGEEQLDERDLSDESMLDETEERISFNQTLDYLLQNRRCSKNIQQQKAILEMLMMGYNVADAAKALGISHKRAKMLVDDIKKNVLKKNKAKFF